MTRKEAIFELIKYRRMLEKDSTIDAEPFDMAIEALEKAAPIPNGNLINFGDIGSPTIKPLERKRGEWKPKSQTQKMDIWGKPLLWQSVAVTGKGEKMSRYIDADEIKYHEDDAVYRWEIDSIPTADVVSKEKYDELNEKYHRLLESANILADAVREYERREDDGIH